MILVDAEARRRIENDLDATLVVEAAAGTGKTTELVARVVSLLREGRTTVSRLVSVTFTEKAAGEMKLRLHAEVERARTRAGISAEERRRFDQALAELEAAHIGTIHSLCADLLRERPIEAGVDPLFEVAQEEATERLFDEAFERWFQGMLADPPEGVRRVLRRRPRGFGAIGPRQLLSDAARALREHRDFTAEWRRDPFDRDSAIDRVLGLAAELAPLAQRCNRGEDYLQKNLEEVARFLAENEARELVRGRDHDGLEVELRELGRARSWAWTGGRGKWYGDALPRQEVVERRDALKLALDQFVELADADLAPCLREELRPVILGYEALKEKAGKLDFLDLLVRARDLIRGDASVRRELQRRFSHLLVDEFQDTDPLQAEILFLLAADDPADADWMSTRPAPGKLFVVGDPKQSIYRFRRADVALYELAKRLLLSSGAELVHLTTSFRSAPGIQDTVNAAFSQVMTGEGGQASYVPLSRYRDDSPGRPSVVALAVPRPYTDWGKLASYKIEESVPDAVGAFVDFLLRKSGWRISERGSWVSIEARHVCILFKRLQSFGDDVTRPYVRALEVRRIPHVLVGGRSFHAREELLAVRNALAAIEWPDDELSVFATLRGPFFALGDDVLLAFRHRFKSLHTLRPFEKQPEPYQGVVDALAILGRLHLGRNRRPIADTLAQLLAATRAHAGVAIWPTGEQALANILRVMDLARRFESGGAISFRAFIHRLRDEAERGGASEAPVVEAGTDGVRMMTVHKAKGLEFPIVILAEPTAPPVHKNPSRYVDAEQNLCVIPLAGCVPIELVERRADLVRREEEEAVRLTYVAATRARDLLIVPTVGDQRMPGWVEVLHPALYPPEAQRRAPFVAQGCPPFGGDSVLDRPEKAEKSGHASVAPGSHAPEVGPHRVCWWDPYVLELDREHDVGLRQQKILEADAGETASSAGFRAHEDWCKQRQELLERGRVPSLVIRTATELAVGGAEAGRITLEETTSVRRGRPHGKRFGTLVHAVLETVALDAGQAAVDAAATAQGRVVGATSDEVTAAAAAAGSALAHPLLVRAARCEHRRECPVLHYLEDGTLAEGVVDLAFRELEGGQAIWTVVDFKTDVELGGSRARYEAQLEIYVRAIAKATGEAARGVLLSV